MKRQILLIDSLGALLSAISLLIIPQFEDSLGIPKSLAFNLAILPIIFFIFSFLSYKFGGQKWQLLLKTIAIANLFYCGLTLYIILTNVETLKSMGIAYFTIEILIILVLAIIELKIATKQH